MQLGEGCDEWKETVKAEIHGKTCCGGKHLEHKKVCTRTRAVTVPRVKEKDKNKIKLAPTKEELEFHEYAKLEGMKLQREVELLDLQKEYFKHVISQTKPPPRYATPTSAQKGPRNNAQTPIRKFDPMRNL